MKPFPIVVAAAIAMAAAAPLAAQEAAPEYDRTAPVTLDGVTETVVWSMAQSALRLETPDNKRWEIALPKSKVLLDMGLSGEVLKRGAPVTVRAYKARNDKCEPRCMAEVIDITLKNQGKTYAVSSAQPAG